MKLRNLFLAGIAAFAMASCSNEVEGVDNGGNSNTEKNATMSFSIGFPTAPRAATIDVGTKEEQTVQNVTVVLVYNNGSPIQVLKFSTENENDLTQEGTSIKTASREVYAGKGVAYVYINPTIEINASNYSSATVKAAYTTTLDGLTNNIAQDNNFVMSGNDVFEAEAGNSNNRAGVKVSRVAAKIIEESPETAFTATDNSKLKITLLSYTFTNLNKESNMLPGTIFKPEVASTGYFQNFVREYNFQTFESVGMAKKDIKGENEEIDNVTYCLENDNSSATTQVLYKAQVVFENENVKNLYEVVNGDKAGLYASFDDLNAAYGGQLETDAYGNLNDGADYADFNEYGIRKYTDGICYYAQDIITTSDNKAKIVRNNIYKLEVMSIRGIGEPGIDTPTPGDPITMLALDITEEAWTINENGFSL